MKGAFLLLVFAALTYADVSPTNNVYDYHRRIGIPRATAIKKYEEELARNPGRIVGGEIADISEVPYQVGIIARFMYIINSACGGTLLSNYYVLTAAHCHNDGVMTAQQFTVTLGSNTIFNGGVTRTTINAQVHPGWNPLTAENDIALLWISFVSFSNVIYPIALPNDNEQYYSHVGTNVLVSGYGINRDGGNMLPSQVLHKVVVKVIHTDACKAAFGHYVHDTSLCTSGNGGKSFCNGDSGGPLVTTGTKKYLIGVASFLSSEGCELEYPAAYTNVGAYLSWIRSIIN